ncbi:hypothetical protein MMC26_001197 [Xylographa opegraphella]|nr:hypothetical protein [Xylographa opegraphella]
MAFAAPAEGEWLSSTGIGSDVTRSSPDSPMDGQPPQHPVPTMQGAFEESMMETMTEVDEPELDNRFSKADSVSRRKMLLEQEKYERTVAGRWKQKPGEKFHPLWKLVAQISFGMHLLQQGMAKSDDEVLKILQTHVDEVDGFLERTTEDFDLAQNDINERIRYLQLPLEHGEVFDSMLDDRAFRTAIVEGNEKIEHIVDRTGKAMKDALKDVQKGLDATRELGRYLTRIEKTWDHRSEEQTSVYLAMIGNTEGWSRAFLTLQQKGYTLSVALVQLGGIIAEIQRRAGIASRRNVVSLQSMERRICIEAKSNTTSPRYSLTPPDSPRKPLPREPRATIDGTSTYQRHDKAAESDLEPFENPRSVEDIQQTLKASARSQLHRTTSKDISRNSSQSNVNKLTAGSESAKPPSRRVSFSERTKSITRKIPFVRDSEEAKDINDSRTQDHQVGRQLSPHSDLRSPIAETRGSRSPRSESSAGQNDYASNDSASQISMHRDSGRSATSVNLISSLSGSPKSASDVPGSVQRLNSIMARPKVVTINSSSSGNGNPVNSVLKNVQAREVRFSNTAPASPIRSSPRDLPLRHYRSQEILPSTQPQSSFDPNSSRLPKRARSVRGSPSARTSSDGLLGSPQDNQLLSVRSAEKQHSRQPSSIQEIQEEDVELPAEPVSAELPGDLTQSSSVYSPEGPTSSKYSLSFSPYIDANGLSPVPAHSSAAPSPLHIASKSQHDVAIIAPDDPETVAEAPQTLPDASVLPATDSAYLLPRSAVALTAFSSTVAPSSSLPRPDTPPEALTSATVSGPEPDINPYDISRSSTPLTVSTAKPSNTQRTAEHDPTVPTNTAPTPSKPTFSPFPSSRPTTATSRSHILYNNFPSPPATTPGALAIVSTRDFVHEPQASDQGSKSPWKKVFGLGIGKGIGSMGRGHKKNRSDVSIGNDRPRTSDGKKRRGGDDGFLGTGKEGVWISRKNFLKT